MTHLWVSDCETKDFYLLRPAESLDSDRKPGRLRFSDVRESEASLELKHLSAKLNNKLHNNDRAETQKWRLMMCFTAGNDNRAVNSPPAAPPIRARDAGGGSPIGEGLQRRRHVLDPQPSKALKSLWIQADSFCFSIGVKGEHTSAPAAPDASATPPHRVTVTTSRSFSDSHNRKRWSAQTADTCQSATSNSNPRISLWPGTGENTDRKCTFIIKPFLMTFFFICSVSSWSQTWPTAFSWQRPAGVSSCIWFTCRLTLLP